MRKRAIWIILSVLLISMMIVGSVYAFYKGNIDGVWGEIDELAYIDVIGQIGHDPGTEWGTGLTSTNNNTIRRNANICYGNALGTDPFDPADEWTGYAQNTLGGLGSHTYSCSGTGLIISEYVHSATSGGRQAIEIFNATDYPISTVGYSIQIFTNGSATASITIPLNTATLAGRDVWVISRTNLPGVSEDQTTPSLVFDGDDAVALVKGGTGFTGAACEAWGTGPTGWDPNAAPTSWQTTWWNQSPPGTDWNQVRYGRPGPFGDQPGYMSCPAAGDTAGFQRQSGFGFNGMDLEDPLVQYTVNQPFLMGTFCHYNNPIYAPTTQGQLHSVPLTVTVSGIRCDDVNISPPLEGDTISFTYHFRLDETPNTAGTCVYPSITPCADAVFVSQPPPDEEFTCDYGTSQVTYTIVALGFMHEDEYGNCPTWDGAMAARDFISDEGHTNCGCMYGMIADEVPQAVELLYFTATAGDGAVILDWETATETDNFGFHLYRATTKDGIKTRLNPDMIPSNVAPGSPYGSAYQFVDETVDPGVRYYYWLEDVDVFMKPTLHGPVDVILD